MAIGFLAWLKFLPNEFFQDERIDRITDTTFTLHKRVGRVNDRLVRPMLRFNRASVGLHRPVQSLINPRPQNADFGRTERITFGRHAKIRIDSSNTVNQGALRAVICDNADAFVAACQCLRAHVQPQTGFLLFWSVAAKTVLPQDWLHVFDEAHFPVCRRRQFQVECDVIGDKADR